MGTEKAFDWGGLRDLMMAATNGGDPIRFNPFNGLLELHSRLGSLEQVTVKHLYDRISALVADLDARESAIRTAGAASDESLLRTIERLQGQVGLHEKRLDLYPPEIGRLQRRIESLEERRWGLEGRTGIPSPIAARKPTTDPPRPPDVEQSLQHQSLEQELLKEIRRRQGKARGMGAFSLPWTRAERAEQFVDWFLDLKGSDNCNFTLGEIKNEIHVRGLDRP